MIVEYIHRISNKDVKKGGCNHLQASNLSLLTIYNIRLLVAWTSPFLDYAPCIPELTQPVVMLRSKGYA